MKAVIKINDEVTCNISGLDIDVRRALMKKFEFDLPGARYSPSVRLGRWNGKMSYFSLAGSTYLNLLEEIIPVLIDYDYEIELDDRRILHPKFNFDEVNVDTFSHITWPIGHERAGQPIVLRDYQVELINAFLTEPQSVRIAATGSGKTIVTAALSKTIEPYGRSLVIVPNKSLVIQTEADYINMGLDVGVYFGDRKEYNKTHTICTWQSLNNIFFPKKNKSNIEDDPKLEEFLVDDVICVIVDEVHVSSAPILKALLTGPLAHVPIRWGLTGTMPKEDIDKLSIQISLGPVTGTLSTKELQDKGVLSNCHVNIIQLKDKVEFTNYPAELKYLVENEHRLDKIAELINKIAETGNTLVLINRVNAGKELTKRLSSAVFVSGGTKLSDRKEEYDEVATSEDKIIVATFGVAAVGINIPRIFNLVLIEPGKSFVRVIQSIGRGVRKAHDKDYVNIYDITSTAKFAKRHLTSRKAFYKEAEFPFSIEKMDL